MASWSTLLAGSSWALASAFAIFALGVATLAGGRARPRGGVAFGAFAITWGLQIASVHAATLAPADLAPRLYLLSIAFLLPLPYFLVEFAASTRGARSQGAWLVARASTAAIALAAAILLVVDPRAIFATTTIEGRLVPAPPLLQVALVSVPVFAALLLALLALDRSRREAATPRIGERHAVLLGGLGLYASFTAGANLPFYALFLAVAPSIEILLYVLTFAALAAGVVRIGVVAWRTARLANTRAEKRTLRLLAAALLAPLAWGVLETVAAVLVLPGLETTGIWRLLGVAVIAYGLARWRIYDLPQRAKVAAAHAGAATAATAGAAATYGAASLATTNVSIPILSALFVLGALLMPSLRFARRLLGVSKTTDAAHERTLYGQRIDAYRAALEASIARGTLDEDAAFLAALRERFHISDAEDRVLAHYARSSVVVARGGDALSAYDRLRLLGEGGAGRTWLARDRVRDRLVVLKEPLPHWQVDDRLREAVLREARLAARVRHPHVVVVEEVIEGRQPAIVMEYLDGGSLADLLRARGRLPWREAVARAMDVLRGLDGIHHAGIVHRDVKPGNVLLDGSGACKISDFGVAVGTASGKTAIAGATDLSGTPSYMPPEVRAGLAPAGKAADVYAAAALLHELVHGAPPGHPSLPLDEALPPALSSALARALHERPEARPPTARALLDDLSRISG